MIRDSDDDDHAERSWLLRLEGLLSRHSSALVIVNGLLLLALIGLIDAVTGSFAVAIFYFVPIAFVTFTRGKWPGLLLAVLASAGWSAVEVAQHVTTAQSPVTYWNALIRFAALAAVSLMIAPMRDALLHQRALAERESAAAERLRALNELREVLASLEVSTGPIADPHIDALFDVLHALDRDWSSTSA